MKKTYVFLAVSIILVTILAHFSIAAIKAATNMSLSKKAIGTYINLAAVTDGVISVKKNAPATSYNVANSDQYLTIDIGKLAYVDRVKVYFDAAAYPDSFEIRTSTNAKDWVSEAADLDAAAGAKDDKDGVIALSISCKRAMIGSRYVQIKVPSESKVSSGNQVRISEVEVFPAMDQKLSVIDTDAYVVTDKTAVIFYKTSIGATGGKVVYGSTPNDLTASVPNQESGIENSATIYGLESDRGYYYRVEANDLYGNTIKSDLKRFETLGNNIAEKKSVTGTFTLLPPGDPFVNTEKPVLDRVTDGSTSYFTSMATSRSIFESDQHVTIDLGKNYSIKNVQTYWRRLAYPEKYAILISSDKKNWKVIVDNLNAADGAFSRSDTGDPMKVVSVPTKDANGRYVKVHIAKDSPFYHKHSNWDFVQLMEVKIFAN